MYFVYIHQPESFAMSQSKLTAKTSQIEMQITKINNFKTFKTKQIKLIG